MNQHRYKCRLKYHSLRCLFHVCFLGLIFYLPFTYADTRQGYQNWNDLNASGKFSKNSKVLYIIETQSRFDLEKGRFQSVYILGGMGYQLLSNLSLWLGYQWISPNLISNTKPVNRLWEQATLDMLNNKNVSLVSRTRLEQQKRSDESQWLYRLRERMKMKFLEKIAPHFTPVIYDEVFMNLNNPQWFNSRGSVNQNRFFIGFDIKTTKRSYLEIGYINRYRWRRPNNILDHIISLSFSVKA